MPLNVEAFLADPNVEDMTGEQRAMWLLAIVESWRRKTLLPADDKKLARALNLDVRRWRSYYKPVLGPLMTKEMSVTVGQNVGEFYRIAKVNAVWDQVANRIAKAKADTAHARAAKAAKHGKQPSAPEPKPAPVAAPVTEPAPAPASALHKNLNKNGEPQPSKRPAVSPFLQSPQQVNGAEHDTEAEPASDPALRHRLVSDGLKPSPKPADRSTLFGALQAAIREEENDD